MTLTSYLSYLAFAIVVIVAPGPDFALTVANTLRSGRKGGLLTSAGIASSNVIQGSAAALGLGALIVHSQVAFNVIRWAGVAYLCYLGIQTIRSAIKGQYAVDDDLAGNGGRKAPGWLRFQQGFLSNITNPKVLTLYLSVLPQFLGTSAALPDALLLAYSHAFFGFAWLVLLVTFLHQIREFLRRRPIRRALDAVTGLAMLAFGAKLATESH
jgi:threonine/homoserine/homoserine lactone efflux protein